MESDIFCFEVQSARLGFGELVGLEFPGVLPAPLSDNPGITAGMVAGTCRSRLGIEFNPCTPSHAQSPFCLVHYNNCGEFVPLSTSSAVQPINFVVMVYW